VRGSEPELSPPPPYEPEVWVREDVPEEAPRRRRREKPASIDTELVRSELTRVLSPAKAKRFTERVADAAQAFDNGRLDDARRVLKPIAEEAPAASTVRELLGLTLYQLGRYRPAATELEAFRDQTGSVDQNPVLADCYRALNRHTDAEELWEELREASPSADLVAEGRIVAAGSLADRDRLSDAIRLLESAPRGKKAREHHLRTAYALADLRERAGDVSRARELFAWISGVDADFADVRQRLSALS
jgi:tetratricopeptide (TPR) repeat protein